MKESRNASNMMVVVKLCIILLVIAVGVFYVDTDNWTPFAPNGVNGFKGVSAVFLLTLDLMRFQQQPKNVRTHNEIYHEV
jgi:amino acid transporter